MRTDALAAPNFGVLLRIRSKLSKSSEFRRKYSKYRRNRPREMQLR
jgi:hypothetical protein